MTLAFIRLPCAVQAAGSGTTTSAQSLARASASSQTARRAGGEASLLRALRLIRSHGGDPDAPLREASVALRAAQLMAGAVEQLSPTDLQAVLAHANVAVSNLDADIKGRERFRGGDYRLLFYCLVGDHSLRQAIERAEEVFAAVNGRMGSLALRATAATAVLDLGPTFGDKDDLAFIVALHGTINYHNIIEWLVGSPVPSVVEMDFDPALAVAIDPTLLPFELRMGARRKAIRFPAAMLERPVIRTFEELSRMPSLNFIFKPAAADGDRDIAARAARTLARNLRESGALCSLPELARLLQVTEIKLRRRLAASGTSYRELRDRARHELALALLQRTDLPIEEIANRLDFCDSDAFRRAMKSWTGQSPTDFRRSRAEPETALQPA